MKPIDRWARDYGHADFDTFIRVGGSVGEAMRDISRRIRSLQLALNSLNVLTAPHSFAAEPMAKTPPPEPPGNFHTEPDEPPDPGNAQIQGAELGG
jgi:hypothetical protein